MTQQQTFKKKLPKKDRLIITDYSDMVVIKRGDNCYKNYFGKDDSYITNDKFKEWGH